MSDAKYCKDCKNMNCPESRVNCKYPDAIACELYRDIPPTIFDHITASLEVLAEKLVYMTLNAGRWEWCSTLLPDKSFETKTEAIAATLARLKEVYNGN